jgi:hypothetical protein
MAGNFNSNRSGDDHEQKEVKAMNQRKIVPGIIFIGLGALFLLRNLGYIHWITLGSLWRFWPLILIVIGINTIFRQHTLVAIITWITLFAVLIGYGLSAPQPASWHQVSQTITEDGRPITIETVPQIEEASFNLNAGAMRLTLNGTDDALMEAFGFPGTYQHQFSRTSDNRAAVRLSSTSMFTPGRQESFRGTIGLNRDILWDVEIEMGAVSSMLDFSEIPLRELDIKVGAGDLTLILVEQEQDANIQISAGASNIVIHVPRNISAQIKTSNVLTQTTMDDRYWNREGNTSYSVGYDPRQPTLNIEVEMGVGRLEIISTEPE